MILGTSNKKIVPDVFFDEKGCYLLGRVKHSILQKSLTWFFIERNLVARSFSMQDLTSLSGWKVLESCPLCNSSKLGVLYHTSDRHYGIDGMYDVGQCHECSLVFLNPMPDDSILVNLYPDSYYSYQNFASNPTISAVRGFMISALFLGRETKDPHFQSSCKVLDIGCGSGKFLSKVKNNGWETYGVEVSKDAAEIGKEKAGLDIFNGTLIEASYPSNHFDYVRSNHSLEHIYNPNETLQEVNRVLKPGGKFLIGVPNYDGLMAGIFKDYWWYLCPPVHTFNYSVKTLSLMLEKNGFKVEKVRYNSNFGGTFGSLLLIMNSKSGKMTMGTISNVLFILPMIIGHYLAKILDLFKLGDAIEIICVKE
jgi:SAM-dependent methyltransferase